MRICLNAALIAAKQTDFRAAGISQYQSLSLRALGEAAPSAWQLEAFVRPGVPHDAYPGIQLKTAPRASQQPLTRILWEQTHLPWAARGADLFHGMAFASPALLQTPLVLTIYDLSFFLEPERVPAARRHYLRRATRQSARRARRILTISAAIAQNIEELLGIPADRIDIAPPGVDRERFRPLPASEIAAFRQQKGLPARYWLYVGTLEPRKNLPTLLEAFARLGGEERPTLILAGGAGWGLAEIQACLTRYQLGDAVLFPGYLPAKELPLWYNGADLFVYPSLYEGFGMPVLEAMACGVPILASDALALRELVDTAGSCAPARDVSAWVAGLRRAAEDTDWRLKTRESSLARAADYSWVRTAAQIIASYEAALGS